ncbi:tRNA pseudouridine(38-40) synthase TruA [candidate division WOR-3 bacterium]|nr:tRNA pseudouridine(38-40) synthase TruA [candidate division WOR-3 bacterium]
MRNLSIVVEYDGTAFYGWQQQPDKRTVQGELETVLGKITGEEIKLTAAGRTDQGVHALGQVANFHTESQLDLDAIKNGANSMAGDDLHIKDIAVVPEDFNSRYWAKSKVYEYHLTFEPSPFRTRYTWYLKQPLDIARMRAAIPSLTGKRDFSHFSVRNGSALAVCDVRDITLAGASTEVVIRVEGDRFLRKMVRGIVGFLVDVGRGRFAVNSAAEIFSGARQDINFAPAQGLFLVSVSYE